MAYILPSSNAKAYPFVLVNDKGETIGANAPVITADSLVPEGYDYIELTYSGGNPTQIVYKQGGSSGTVVATLSITYEDGNVKTITRT